jgi:hypothetical protein
MHSPVPLQELVFVALVLGLMIGFSVVFGFSIGVVLFGDSYDFTGSEYDGFDS